MRSKRKKAVEAVKSLLIVLLGCSALWLLIFGGLFGRWNDVLNTGGYGTQENAAPDGQKPNSLPRSLAIVGNQGCYGIQYEQEALSAQFDRLAPLLSEALSATEGLERITQEQWERALLTAPAVYMDFQGNLPLQVLSAWLSGQENCTLTATVRRLLLGAEEDGVVLYYQDTTDGQYYLCRAQATSLGQLESIVSAVQANGANFACQSQAYDGLAPETLISPSTPRPREFAASDPLAQDAQERLEQLLDALSFPVGITTVYDMPDGRRARSGNDVLTITNGSTVTYRSPVNYHNTQEEGRYPVTSLDGESELLSAVNSAWRLAAGAIVPWIGDARLCLTDVQKIEQGSWQITFSYVLDNIAVTSGRYENAAVISVEGDYITQFELNLRSYAALEQTTLLLPQAQAAAALESKVGAGGYLQLRYQEYGDTVRAGWIAG